MQRRKFIKNSMMLGVGGALGTLTGCGAGEFDKGVQAPFTPGQPLPWKNWAHTQACTPQWRISPSTEDQLVEALKSAKGAVRPVGSGHSFSGLVPTQDTMISTDLLSGLVGHDVETMQATLLAGTRLSTMGSLLHSVGQSIPNMPDMDYPALGGAIATSTHGTGSELQCTSAYVAGLKLATVTGDILECSATKNPEVFHAARNSLGALGIVSEVTLQNQAAYNITETNRVENTEDILEDIDARCAAHRHFEYFPLPYSSLSMTVTTDFAKPGDVAQGADDTEAVNTLRTAFDSLAWIPLVGEKIYDSVLLAAIGDSAAVVRTGPSHEVFPHVRSVRFREMEYTVPAEFGAQCVKEVLETIRAKKLPLGFPLEVRYLKQDDVWLSMFEGRDGCSISIHQFGDLKYAEAFAEVEKVFWKYNGRPHWGKIHTLSAKQLKDLYPRHWQDFQEVRQSLDPQGKLMNAHLREILG